MGHKAVEGRGQENWPRPSKLCIMDMVWDTKQYGESLEVPEFCLDPLIFAYLQKGFQALELQSMKTSWR